MVGGVWCQVCFVLRVLPRLAILAASKKEFSGRD